MSERNDQHELTAEEQLELQDYLEDEDAADYRAWVRAQRNPNARLFAAVFFIVLILGFLLIAAGDLSRGFDFGRMFRGLKDWF